MSSIRIRPIYSDLLTTDKKIIDLLGGRGRGGSHAMAQHAIISLVSNEPFHAFFMRAIHKDIRKSLWKGFVLRLQECFDSGDLDPGDFHLTHGTMQATCLSTGNTINAMGFKTSSGGQTANLKSLEGATTAYIEEAEETTYSQHKKLVDSLRRGKMQIIRSWNIPTKEHYLINKWYNIEPVLLHDAENVEHDGWFRLVPKGIHNHLAIFGTYKDNIKNIPQSKIDEWEQYFFDDPEHYWSDICGFASGGAKGVIMKFGQHWHIYNHLPDIEFYTLYGLDFGGGGRITDEPDGSSKTVLLELNVNKATRSVYIRLKVYKGYIDTDDLCDVLDNTSKRKHEVLADNARADKITELQIKGYMIIPAKSKEGASNAVKTGYDVIKLYKTYVYDGDEPVKVEFNNHKWATDPSGNPTDKPEDKYKDILDAYRYALTYYHRSYGW